MDRDYTQYPDNINGDALWGMFRQGDKLEQPRTVNFSVIFPTKESALEFGSFLLENEQRVQFSKYDGNEEFPWEITVSPIMAITYDKLVAYEAQLAEDAERWGGHNDGWGCFQQD